MVDHVIIALEYALAILRISQGVFHIRVRGVNLAGGGGTEPHILFVIQIQPDGVIRAGIRMRAAVDAAFRRVCRRVFAAEVLERAERLDLRAFFLHQPLQQVNVVAGLGQQHEIAFCRVAPVAADKAVTLMDITESFRMDDRHDITQHALVDQLLDARIERRIAQYMADHELPAVFARLIKQIDAFVLCARQRFFQQHIVSVRQCLHGRLIMHTVLCRNDRKIGKPWLRQQLLPGMENVIVREVMLILNVSAMVLVRISNGNNAKFFRQRLHNIGVNFAAVACANQRNGKDFH